MAAFDWYQATVPQPVDDVLEALSDLGNGLKVAHGRGHHGYATTTTLGNERDGVVAKVWHGGSHAYPHAVVSGDLAQAGAELIRAAFPEHFVSRYDVREDYAEEGAFDAIQEHLLTTAKAHRVKVGTAGDHLLTREGRSTYLGAPSSAVRMRLYDKRAEVLAKWAFLSVGQVERLLRRGPDGGWELPEHWARLEAQIRPQTKQAKAEAARLDPVDALGSAAWMREVWRAVAGLDLQPVQVGRGYRAQDDERAYRYMLSQYGGMLRRLQADLGDWACVGLQLGADLAEAEKRAPGGDPPPC